MTIDQKIRDEKLQHRIIREKANIFAKSSGKTNKYECLTVTKNNLLIKIESFLFSYKN